MKIKYKPEKVRLLEMPYSEVCMHMRIAGKLMWGELVNDQAVQLYDLDCHVFSFPIGRGEAGWDWWTG